MTVDSPIAAIRAAEWVGRQLSARQQDLLATYQRWIIGEAVTAGGVGPNETERIWSRHIADSLVFGVALPGAGECADLGSGVGLPGIPLAIVYPEISFTLVDRSGRRCDLMKRALNVVGLSNCVVLQSDIEELHQAFDVVVSRAAIPADRLMIHMKHLLRPGGSAVVALSRRLEVGTGAVWYEGPDIEGLITTTITVPSEILDTKAILLRIEASSPGDTLYGS